MKKFVAILIFLTLFCAGAFATGFTLKINAYDLNTMAPINVSIVKNFIPTGHTTPDTFYEPGEDPDITETIFYDPNSVWECADPCYTSWLPISVAFQVITASYELNFYGIYNCPVPVELSSFTAVLTAQNFVNLTWVSQSETVMLGYRVYRSETNSQQDALMITEAMIPATNTSTTQTYSIEDTETEIGHTYYYWLESVDMGSSEFHGPVSVLVEGEVPPVLPEITSMKSAYPNPFKENTNIEVSVKAGESGSITIYNILGQAVRSYNVEQGTHTINWDGLNSKGDKCGSGIYFYKLATPSVNQTKKMVVVK